MTLFERFVAKDLSVIERYFRYVNLSVSQSVYNDIAPIENVNIISDEEKELVKKYFKSEDLFLSLINKEAISYDDFTKLIEFRKKANRNIF